MLLREIQDILESWAPEELAWERDNTGLQIGSGRRQVNKILVTLDITDALIREARKKNIDVIISHHPLIFQAASAVNTGSRMGRLLSELIKLGIDLYTMHTNLDFTHNGVSFSLAERIGLQEVEVLDQKHRIDKKIVVYAPEESVEHLISAMSAEGAGVIGNYERCSFRARGVGTFRPGQGTRPFTGRVGKNESADEVRLEMIAPAWRLDAVLRAMRVAHPYEEVAYDVYDLANVSSRYGAGAIGELQKRMSLKVFLAHVKRRLQVPVLRYASDP
ncbi:MAG TPA: Nif3-like dinuclear metal center hexameric protein, partial [Bacteroidota bacterium]|nr:Nif3-like dinuclear metal center hexameric protein [Bacteroidota bacterium]